LIALFKIFKGQSRVRIDELFMMGDNMKGTRVHCVYGYCEQGSTYIFTSCT